MPQSALTPIFEKSGKLQKIAPVARYALAAFALLCLAGPARAAVIDRVVAVVNKEIITQSEVEEAQKARKKEGQTISQRELLNQMIEKKLELQTAKKRGIRVGDDELKLALDDIKQRNGFANDDALKQALTQEGISWEKYLENLRDELTVLKLVSREVDPNILLTEDELKAYYESEKSRFLLAPRIRLGQIFLAVSSNASPEEVESAQKRAQEIEAQLKQGRDFGDLAREYGEGPERHSAGDIGYFHKGDLSPAVEEVVFQLNEGEVSDVLRSPAGFHIFKVEEKKTAEYKPFDEARKQVEEGILARKREELRQKFVSELWANSYVEIK